VNAELLAIRFNFVTFKTTPTLPIVVGGLFILAGGVIITAWRA